MPPSTMSSTSNVILFPGQRFAPSDRKPRRIGTARLLRHDRQLGVNQLSPGRAKLTKPSAMLSNFADETMGPLLGSVRFQQVMCSTHPAASRGGVFL
jgi:hypothetical protein